MRGSRVPKAVSLLALAAGLAACGGDYERVETAGPGEGEVPAIVPPRSEGEFNPELDEDRDGALDPEEGMGDADGDGVRDRDEAYVPGGAVPGPQAADAEETPG